MNSPLSSFEGSRFSAASPDAAALGWLSVPRSRGAFGFLGRREPREIDTLELSPAEYEVYERFLTLLRSATQMPDGLMVDPLGDKQLRVVLSAFKVAVLGYRGAPNRATGEIFLSHGVEVAEELYRHGCRDEEVLAVGLGHDLHEEGDILIAPRVRATLARLPENSREWNTLRRIIDYSYLKEEFDLTKPVAEGILALSKVKVAPGGPRGDSSLRSFRPALSERESYRNQLDSCDPRWLAAKIADVRCNSRTYDALGPEKAEAQYREARDLIDHVFRRRLEELPGYGQAVLLSLDSDIPHFTDLRGQVRTREGSTRRRAG